MPFMDSVIP